MSITKEPRGWARQFRRIWVDPHSGDLTYITNEHACPPSLDAVRLEDYLTAIADRIDAEHERLMQEQPFTIDMVPMTDENMAEHGWVRLPLDADGEVIHIGDVMENLREDLEPQLHHTFRVYSIQYRDYEQMCALTEDGYPTILYRANECRHYHAPAIEDVLREFAEKIIDSQIPSMHPTYEETIAEYVKRLKLAERVDA